MHSSTKWSGVKQRLSKLFQSGLGLYHRSYRSLFGDTWKPADAVAASAVSSTESSGAEKTDAAETNSDVTVKAEANSEASQQQLLPSQLLRN